MRRQADPLARAGAAIDLAFAHANLGMIREGLDWTARAEENAAVAGDAGVAAEAAAAAAQLIFLSGGGVDRRRLTPHWPTKTPTVTRHRCAGRRCARRSSFCGPAISPVRVRH